MIAHKNKSREKRYVTCHLVLTERAFWQHQVVSLERALLSELLMQGLPEAAAEAVCEASLVERGVLFERGLPFAEASASVETHWGRQTRLLEQLPWELWAPCSAEACKKYRAQSSEGSKASEYSKLASTWASVL